MKKYIVISGLMLNDNNRGTAALGYGAFGFLQEKKIWNNSSELLDIRIIKNFLKKDNRTIKRYIIQVQGKEIKKTSIPVFFVELWLLLKFRLLLPFTPFGKHLRKTKCIAAINGGDGFSDIYSTSTYLGRLKESEIAIAANIPLVILPQTLGPFENHSNYEIAEFILKNASSVYVRDDKFVPELKKMGIKYEITNDLSAYMKPEPWDISIDKSNSIGINVSGLAYSNSFRTLSGQFDYYPYLINSLIEHFQQKGKMVYLIPHSYHYGSPEPSNDDLLACRETYFKLIDKRNVILIEKDLKSPQIKYLISQMSFFIGTRMHANYAAIFTNVPLYGLAYSYKFQGAFEHNGIFNRISMINNIGKEDISYIIENIEKSYQEDTK